MKAKIKRWGINGEGIAYIKRKAVFVKNAIPDEVVDLEITESHPRYDLARAKTILQKSPRRRNPLCPLWEQCGGCSLMHLDYKGQVRMKEQILKESLRKYADYNGPITPMVKNPDPLGYRNACKLPFGKKDGKLITGMYKTGTNEFIGVDRCIIHSKKLEQVRKEITEVLNHYDLPVSEKGKTAGLMNLVLKEFNQNVAAVLVTTDMELPEGLVEEILDFDGITSLWQSVKTEKDPDFELFGNAMVHLGGNMLLHLEMQDLELSLLPRSFFQLNTRQALNLYQIVSDLVPEKQSLIVEAYSGIGAISLFVADKADQVIGIEYVEDAVASAKQNALANGKDNVSFLCGDAAKELKKIVKDQKIDTLIVDPPRSGLDDPMKETILHSKPEQVIYISCNPATLAKDIHDLQGEYQIEKVIPVDMFSQTPHVETVVLMARKEKKGWAEHYKNRTLDEIMEDNYDGDWQ